MAHVRVRRCIRTCAAAGFFTLAVHTAEPEATGNDGSFSRAAESAAQFLMMTVQGDPAGCAVLTGTASGGRDVTITSAVVLADVDIAYCRVAGLIPAAIEFVLYLPLRWNGRLYMHGNGGDAGEPLDHPPYHALRMNALRNGFAAVYTNTGHDSATEPGAVWARDNPAREADYGHRAVHVSIASAKMITAAYYGVPASRSYFDGCSTGGRQGMMEAQRHAEDFDGILAGAPVFDLPDMLWQYWKNSRAVEVIPVTPERLAQLGEFIRARYDKIDGVEDGVIGDPLAIDFLPSRDLPRTPDEPDGFTQAELDTLDLLYAPVMAGGREIFPRTVVGAELPGQVYRDGDRHQVRMESAWVSRVVPDDKGFLLQPLILDSWFRYLAFDTDDPGRDWRSMDPARDGSGMERMRGLLRAADPNLRAFAQRGGKLILYHGWADFGVNPLRTIQYVDRLRAMSSLRADDYLRLYLVPGMFHCSGGTNVDFFDLMTPLIDWVERGVPPAEIPAARLEQGRVTRTRQLCPYPQTARYDGRDDAGPAAEFHCNGSH